MDNFREDKERIIQVAYSILHFGGWSEQDENIVSELKKIMELEDFKPSHLNEEEIIDYIESIKNKKYLEKLFNILHEAKKFKKDKKAYGKKLDSILDRLPSDIKPILKRSYYKNDTLNNKDKEDEEYIKQSNNIVIKKILIVIKKTLFLAIGIIISFVISAIIYAFIPNDIISLIIFSIVLFIIIRYFVFPSSNK